MGNKTTQVLPAVITKNWHPLSPDGDIYHNKLTDEYVRQKIVKVSNTDKLNSLKTRLKQKNPYICRVAFYYHLSEDVYYVYTDETRNRPKIVNLQEWKVHKQNIVDSFIQLSKVYGPTRVCREMIGVDLKGQIKIWIHPDTVAWQRWCPCKTQTQMIADILAIFRLFEKQSNPFKNKAFLKLEKRLFNKNLDENYVCIHKNHNESKQKTYQQIHQNRQIPIAKQINIYKIQISEEQKYNLKLSDLKTSSTQYDKDKYEPFIDNNSFGHKYDLSNDKTQIKDQNIWDRRKKSVFKPTFNKNNSRQICYDKNASLKKSLKINKHKYTKSQIKSQKNLTSYGINKQPIQQKIQTQQNPNLQQINIQIIHKQNIKRTKKFHNNKCKFFTNQQSIDFLKHHVFKSKEVLPTMKKQNLANKLMNVAEMIVKEQRQSELTYTEMLDDHPKKQLKKQIQMTMSQQLWNIFDELQGKEYQQAKQIIKKKSIFYEEIKNQIDILFN